MNLNEGFRLIGSSKRMREVQEDLEKVAHTDYSVLLVGETGSGKEVAARHLHRKSRRSHMSFLGFNCSNLTDETAGSQLFGHERGSFTDAYTTKIGIFERTNKGTLFLDEVETLKPEVQARLLRFLETGKFERLGGTVELGADVRIISGTNYELHDNANFRQDLYYRLNEFRINIPSLREHAEDIPELADFYVALLNSQNGSQRRLDRTAYDALAQYKFPGNIRELINILKRAHLFAQRYVIDGETVQCAIKELNRPVKVDHNDASAGMVSNAADAAYHPEEVVIYPHGFSVSTIFPWSLKESSRRLRKYMLVGAAKITNGNMSEAAKLMDIDYSTIKKLIKILGYKDTYEFCRDNGILSDRYGYQSRQHEYDQRTSDDIVRHVNNSGEQGNSSRKSAKEKWADALHSYDGNVKEAARSLNRNPATLYTNVRTWGYSSVDAFRKAWLMNCHRLQ